MADNAPVLGKIIDGVAFRDAVHVAVAPLEAGCVIKPGGWVRMTHTGLAAWTTADDETAIGIADPFLTRQIERGERFYAFMRPNTVHGLRHAWTHPAFTAKPITANAVDAWLAGESFDMMNPNPPKDAADA